jgi:dihydroneopterin aldolase
VKVGGSLFEYPGLRHFLRDWLALFPKSILVAGGGAAAESVRQACQLHGLSDVDAHWLAIDAMSFQSRLLATMLLLPWTQERERARASIETDAAVVFDAMPLLRKDDGRTLPIGWQVTSDSIAAYVARSLGVPSLVLLKSVDCGESLEEALERGAVDRYFPVAASGLAVCCVNVRSENPLGNR